MSFRFHWGGQVSADVQAQNQMLFDAMPREQQQRVLAAQAERAAMAADLGAAHTEHGWRVLRAIGRVFGILFLIGGALHIAKEIGAANAVLLMGVGVVGWGLYRVLGYRYVH